MPGFVSLEAGEIERIEWAKLVRLGVRPDDIDAMNGFDRLDLLELDAVQTVMDQKQLATLVANELAKVLVKVMRRR